MNRPPRALPMRAALLCALLLAITVAIASATPALSFLPASLASIFPSIGSSRAVVNRPLSANSRKAPSARERLGLPYPVLPGQRPPVDLTRRIPGTASVQQAGNVPSTSDVPRQAVNQTTFPRPPQFGATTPSDDVQPVWAPDESWIYFASNRANANGTTAGQRYHIWRMSTDGNRVEQITGITGDEVARDQLFPAIAPNGLIAFSERAGPGSPSDIIILDIRDNRNRIRTRITGAGLAPQYVLGDAIQPTWSPGSESIAFAANRDGVYNIYTINRRLGDVIKLTNGTAANGIDSRNPDWSPAGTLIAFDSNAAGVEAATGLLAGTAPKRNIYITYLTGPNSAGTNGANTQPYVKMTNFPDADSIEPAFSQKAGSNPPNDTDNNRLLVFASQRADTDDDGVADAAVDTFNLYWIIADRARTELPNTRDSTPENPTSNPAFPIITQDTDPNLPLSARNRTNERYPSFPPFIRSTRIAYQSDSTGNNDIWTAAFVDVTAPSLEALNEGSSEILRVAREGEASPAPSALGRREFVPGDRVVFMARVRDLQSGIRRESLDGNEVPVVYLQIRDPDSKYQDAAQREHKTYWREPGEPGDPGAPQNPIAPMAILGSPGQPPDLVLRMPEEQSSEVIDANDRRGTIYAHPWFPFTEEIPPPPPDPDMEPDPNCPPPPTLFKVLPPVYIPAGSDIFAWSGQDFPPRDEWLPLYDDGPVPGGHEPAGQVAGDSIFSNVWQTPAIPSDWVLDVVTYDRATDPLGRGPGENWKIWDNVWGFTTQPFVARNPVLAVMDYPEGQRFIITSSGRGITNTVSFQPVESYLLDLDISLFPGTEEPEDPLACPPEMVDALIGSNPQQPVLNTLGVGSFRNNQYDLWRVLCRGPVDRQTVLNYTPTTVDQVDPAAFDQAPRPDGRYPTVRVQVSEKAVFWASPYTGDLWTGRGHLTDASMQALLTEFVVERGGRLFITGQDIGWALTLEGSITNNFYRDVLKAGFFQDEGSPEGDNLAWKQESNKEGDSAEDWMNRDIATPTAPRIVQFPPDPYRQVTDTKAPAELHILGHSQEEPLRTDGAFNQFFPDKIIALAGTIPAYTYADTATIPAENNRAGVYHIDPKTGGRVVYLSFGLESVYRGYDSGEGNTQIVLNFRSKLLHNALCWMTTGQIRGRVLDVQGLRPVSGAVVRATPNPNAPVRDPFNDGAAVRTAVTDANGNYVIRGVVPQYEYDIEAAVPGYNSQHFQVLDVHGMEAVGSADLLVSRAAPGSISGTVRNAAGAPIPNAVVLAKLTAAEGFLGQTDFAASTNAQGQFRFGDLPTGSYTLRVDPDWLQSSGFSGTTPPTITAGVQPARDIPNTDFVLGGGGTDPGPDPGPGPGPGGLLTLQPGLHLISTPYDYPGEDLASLLGLQPSDLNQKVAVYMGDSGGFRLYSDPSARNLRIGRGYFIRLAKPAAITRQGTPAPTDRPYSLALTAGWNLIGNPFTTNIPWSAVKVQVPGQSTELTLAQAIQQGVLRSGLLTLGGNPYRDSSTLEVWKGYWVRATRPVTLLIPPPGSTASRRQEPLPKWRPDRDKPPSAP